MDNYIIKKDFPIFNNNNIVYLDSSATTQKPYYVLEKINKYYKMKNANPHRGSYKLSIEATKEYEKGREKVSEFINSKNEKQIIFTKNATESLNLIAYSYGLENLKKGDKIVLSIMEHHSNLVPWQYVAQKTGAIIEYMYINENGEILEEEIENKITNGVKIVGITHVSNVLGTINNVEKIIKKAHDVGAITIVDSAQSIPHKKIDVEKLDTDFMVFSGHKMLAPLGIGVLYGKEEILKNMKPFLYGGDMIEYVNEQNTTFAQIPSKFEAGTQNVEGVVGLNAAIDYLNKIGMNNIEKIEKEILKYALKKLQELDFINIYGTKNIETQSSVISFNVKNVHSHDVSSVLDSNNIYIRSGSHCAQPLLKYMCVDSTCRLSIYIYNTKEDIDKLIEGLYKTKKMFSKLI